MDNKFLDDILIADRLSSHIASSAKRQKPHIRELVKANGIEFPTDEELIMLILGSGTTSNPVEKIAEKAIRVINETDRPMLYDNLRKIKGLGESKAYALAAAVELGYRKNRHHNAIIFTPQDLLPYIKHYALDAREHFITATLNGHHEILDISVIAVGSPNKTVFHPREVFAKAIVEHASGIICCHNHPAGPCFPSKADEDTTIALQKAADLLGISFIDHIIITKDSYFSFMEHGLLTNQ